SFRLAKNGRFSPPSGQVGRVEVGGLRQFGRFVGERVEGAGFNWSPRTSWFRCLLARLHFALLMVGRKFLFFGGTALAQAGRLDALAAGRASHVLLLLRQPASVSQRQQALDVPTMGVMGEALAIAVAILWLTDADVVRLDGVQVGVQLFHFES